MTYKEDLVVVAIMGFQGFKKWLGVLIVNVKFSSSFLIFPREVLTKRFKYFLWSFSVSVSRARRRIMIL
jgi:hypothetical protein